MKWRVYGRVHGSKYLGEFEADTRERAEELAANSEKNHVGLCHACAREFDLNDPSCQEFDSEPIDYALVLDSCW